MPHREDSRGTKSILEFIIKSQTDYSNKYNYCITYMIKYFSAHILVTNTSEDKMISAWTLLTEKLGLSL
jgi:hypothetical protein